MGYTCSHFKCSCVLWPLHTQVALLEHGSICAIKKHAAIRTPMTSYGLILKQARLHFSNSREQRTPFSRLSMQICFPHGATIRERSALCKTQGQNSCFSGQRLGCFASSRQEQWVRHEGLSRTVPATTTTTTTSTTTTFER